MKKRSTLTFDLIYNKIENVGTRYSDFRINSFTYDFNLFLFYLVEIASVYVENRTLRLSKQIYKCTHKKGGIV